MAEESKIILRPAVIEDKNFILSTWLKGQYYGCAYFRQMPQDLYFDLYGQRVVSILYRPDIRVDVACDLNDPTWIVGFCVYKEPEIYWIHVKKDFRQKGIASLLVKEKNLTTVKATTQIGRALADTRGLIFNPL